MRRNVIYGLIGLLIVIIALDFNTTSENPPSNSIIIQNTLPSPLPPTITPEVVMTATPIDDAPPLVESPVPTLSGETLSHTLQSGETLFNLAQIYGTTVEAIMAVNNIVDPTRIQVGTLLVIPGVTTAIPPTITPIPTTQPPTATPQPEEPALPIASPGPITPADILLPANFNGLAFDTIIVMPPNVRQHIHEIYAQGQSLGNNPHAFSRLGDSTIEHPYFLARFDTGPYDLGGYAYLQQIIDYYAGSFNHAGVAVRRGLHTWSVLDSMWAPKPTCGPGEHMLACEFRLHRPSILFVRLGSNDVGIPESTDRNLREIVEYTINSGVIPIMGTKADRHDGPNNVNNNIIRQVAADYAVPLWDYDLIAGTIPGRGLDIDGVHMTTFFAHDYTSPVALTRGHGVHNLTALMALDALWRELNA